MQPDDIQLLTEVLVACTKTFPDPLYPSDFVHHTGVDRVQLDRALDELRLRGLITLTDWKEGRGQGYLPTEDGFHALHQPQRPASFETRQPRRNASEEESEWDKGERIRDVFLAPKPARLTTLLITLTVLWFLYGWQLADAHGISTASYFQGRGDARISAVYDEMGSFSTFNLFDFESWWRLIAYQFVHAGAFHILMNMAALYSLGPILENMWGRVRFLMIYLYAGAVGGFFAIWWANRNLQNLELVGASGAVYGILTSLAVWAYLNRDHLGEQISQAVFANVRSSLILMLIIAFVPGISFTAHLGGAVAGAIISLPMHFVTSRIARVRFAALLGLIVIGVAPFALMTQSANRDVPRSIVGARFEFAEQFLWYEVFNKVYVPAVKGKETFDQPEVLQKAKEVIPAGQKILQGVRAQIAALPNKSDEFQAERNRRLDYLDAWNALITELRNLPDAKDRVDWKQEPFKLGALAAQMRLIRETLKANEVFAAPEPLKFD